MKKSVITLSMAVLLLSCRKSEEAADYTINSSKEMSSEAAVAADSTLALSNDETYKNTVGNMVTSAAASEKNKPKGMQFVRTAELKMKVKNVAKATYAIEDLTVNMGGYVTNSNLQSNVDYSNNTAISEDSTLVSKYYTMSNTITLKVPNTKLDTTLKQLVHLIDFLDYRVIKADEVSMQLMANNLTQQRSRRTQQRIATAIDNRGRKLTETLNGEDRLLSSEENADNAYINNQILANQIAYSEITLNIYQGQNIFRELIANETNIKAYEPGFGFKMKEALATGWYILESFILFLTKIWALILVAIAGFFAYKKIKSLISKPKTN